MDYTKLTPAELVEVCGKDEKKWHAAFHQLMPARVKAYMAVWQGVKAWRARRKRELAEQERNNEILRAGGSVTAFVGGTTAEQELAEIVEAAFKLSPDPEPAT